jgi:hypothetical protein
MNLHAASSAAGHQCLMTARRAGLDNEPATVMSLDRRGAVLSFAPGWRKGSSIVLHDPIELDLVLPANEEYGQRSIRCLGTVIQISEDDQGRLWVVVRFRQMFIRPRGNEQTGGVDSAGLRPGDRARNERGVRTQRGGLSPAKSEKL